MQRCTGPARHTRWPVMFDRITCHMSIEERIAALESEREIAALYVHYCELADSCQSDRIAAEFYAEEISADYHYAILNGRKEVHEFYVSGMAVFAETAHSLSNLVIHACDGEVAEASSMLIAFHWHADAADDGAEPPADFGLVVRSEDRLRRTAEGWRVTNRRARAIGPAFELSEVDIGLRRRD